MGRRRHRRWQLAQSGKEAQTEKRTGSGADSRLHNGSDGEVVSTAAMSESEEVRRADWAKSRERHAHFGIQPGGELGVLCALIMARRCSKVITVCGRW